MKMPAVKGVITVRGNQQLARDIERVSLLAKEMSMRLKLTKYPHQSKSQKETKKKHSNKNVR